MTSQEIKIDPINHASVILDWGIAVVYADPVNEDTKDMFAGKPDPDLILVTDIHGDHFDFETIKKVSKDNTVIVAPRAVADEIPEDFISKVVVMKNGDLIELFGFKIEAIPAYNLPGTSEQYHVKGRGNAYVIEAGGVRVYISGDTAGVPEMRTLKNIDIAFVAMNLPYTMDPIEAASAVLDFKPRVVYPYHYRQKPTNDFADVVKFKEIVNSKNSRIKVVQEDWYK